MLLFFLVWFVFCDVYCFFCLFWFLYIIFCLFLFCLFYLFCPGFLIRGFEVVSCFLVFFELLGWLF